jgi:hypothetical protein
MFLIVSVLLSFLLPLSPVKINLFNISETFQINSVNILNIKDSVSNQNLLNVDNSIDIGQVILIVYLLISGFFITRFFASLIKVFSYIAGSEKINNGSFTYVFLDKKIVAFSFFHWIFISKLDKYSLTTQIIEHEKVHAQQYHSIDIILSELMVAAMWVNPFVWMLKKAIQQIHEFLADQGVINSGVNPLEYKKLLVNQAAGDKLIAISSNFSYSLIKKRLIMISKEKKENNQYYKMLIIIPIAALVFLGVSMSNNKTALAQKSDKSIAINSLANDNNGATLITRSQLLGNGQLSMEFNETEYSQFFKVVSFTVSTMIKNFEESYDQPNGPAFTKQQIDLIKRSQSGRKVYIENIKVIGLEGEIINLGSIVFTIK